MLAKSQHRPEDRWFVMGAPSNGMRMLNTCWSAILADREVRTSRGFAELRAERANLQKRDEKLSVPGSS